jgi:hypothetical protein
VKGEVVFFLLLERQEKQGICVTPFLLVGGICQVKMGIENKQYL